MAADAVDRFLIFGATRRTGSDLARLWERSLALVHRNSSLIAALAEALVRQRLIGRWHLPRILRKAAVKHAVDEEVLDTPSPRSPEHHDG